MAAQNALGTSVYSKPITLATAGSAPNIPEVPVLLERTPSSLLLSWSLQENADEYELQMQDEQSPQHGFLTVYNGSQTSYKVTQLRNNSRYSLRLRARNDDGSSGWCEPQTFVTNSDVPRCCSKLRLKPGHQVTATQCRLSWGLS